MIYQMRHVLLPIPEEEGASNRRKGSRYNMTRSKRVKLTDLSLEPHELAGLGDQPRRHLALVQLPAAYEQHMKK